MTTAQHLANLTALLAACLVLWRAEQAISRMGAATNWMIRYAMLTLSGAAIGFILTIPAGKGIDIFTLAALVGVALLLVCERRLLYLARQRRGGKHA